jgi:hypothetical protein
VPPFNFEEWRKKGKPDMFCLKEKKHPICTPDDARPIGLRCGICAADVVFEEPEKKEGS